MANKQFGALCPEGHGLLVERDDWVRRGVAWCPHSDHGGNGRFYRRQEVEEGWFDPTRITATLDRAQAERLEAKAAERAAAWEANLEAKKVRQRMNDEAKPKAAKVKTPQDCGCGCGGQTKGGRFIPGHDARYHSRIRTLEAQGISHDEAASIASKGPLPAKYQPVAEAKAEKPTPITKAKSAKKPKQPDLTAKASDEPAEESTEDAATGADFEV